jgi:hypothetical protein
MGGDAISMPPRAGCATSHNGPEDTGQLLADLAWKIFHVFDSRLNKSRPPATLRTNCHLQDDERWPNRWFSG